MPAPQPKTVSHEQLGHLSHRETAGRYLVPPSDPEGAPGHSAGAGVACVSPSYCLCQASCSCLHLEGSKVHLGGTIKDRLTVSGRDALWGFAAMCLPEKAWSCSECVPLRWSPMPTQLQGTVASAITVEQGSSGWWVYSTLRHPRGPRCRVASWDGCTPRNSVSALLLPRSPCACSDTLTPLPRDLG